MTAFSAEPILDGLKSFQRDAVAHVMYRLHDAPNPSGRFLVADETGLGKSVVARGVIAKTIERLQDEKSVKRIDIVYVCSNADLASQNLRRLNVTGDPHIGLTSRLTLLALESGRLKGPRATLGKPVNLVSFTPGTSFDMGSWRTGSAEERSLLHVMLSETLRLDEDDARASRILFQGPVHTEGAFSWRIDRTRRQLNGPVDPSILRAFKKGATEVGLTRRYKKLLKVLRGEDAVPAGLTDDVRHLTGEFRACLAKASIDTLEPDLVILDEFQRFRHLLDPQLGGDAAELAHSLFNYKAAKVLLLSATPYKPFTEAGDASGENHHDDLMTTLGFLAHGSDVSLDHIRSGFSEYRNQIVNGRPADAVAANLQARLLTLMSRTERPQVGSGAMLVERRLRSAAPTTADLIGYSALERLAGRLDVPVGLEYWKSIPYFASFMDSYKVSGILNQALASNEPDIAEYLRPLQQLDAAAIRAFTPTDMGNSHLRALAEETLDQGWWKLLWLPPSMPYLQPGAVYGQEVRPKGLSSRRGRQRRRQSRACSVTRPIGGSRKAPASLLTQPKNESRSPRGLTISCSPTADPPACRP